VQGSHRAAQTGANRVAVVIPDGLRRSTLHASGARVLTEWHTVWRPICGSKPAFGPAVEADLLRTALKFSEGLRGRADRAEHDGGEDSGGGGIAGGSFNIHFDLDGSVPAQAMPAIDAVEAAIEALFADPINITIEISFDDLSGGTLGVTSSPYTHISYSTSRDGLQDDADDTDGLLQRLPSGSSVPVRYNGNNHSITLENRVFWSLANYKATIGAIGGDAGSIIFNDDITWDYDPSNGVVGYSFQDVLAHEVGHALGFTSGADFRDKDLEVMDLFRFQKNDDGHDYNPDSWAEFRVRPRLVSDGAPPGKHITDFIQHTFPMSDGTSHQPSHFDERLNPIGLMDPALSWGETHWPALFNSKDLRVLDAIGWDR